jgi:hypothetical protein
MPIINQNTARRLVSTKLFTAIFGKPWTVDASSIDALKSGKMTPEQVGRLRNLGVGIDSMRQLVNDLTSVNFERMQIYREAERAMLHPMIGAAVELYADFATTYNRQNNATMWVSSDSDTVKNEIERMLDDLGAEERMFDHASATGMFGDAFWRIHGEEGAGVVHMEDDRHPSEVSRVDMNGRLIGFVLTPQGQVTGPSNEQTRLIPPWEYVHSRIIGAVRRRATLGSPTYAEYRSMDLVGHDGTRMSTRYGTSLLLNALPAYKRLRLAEDSILLARLSKGLLRYIYKVVVDTNNPDAAIELMEQYASLLKRARAIDTTPGREQFDDKLNDMSVLEDIIVPVWGDKENLTVEKLGGEIDIRWIKDIDELKRQLSIALRVPLALLGDTSEMPSGFGQSALERIDIRFARHARRLQRALVASWTRVAQLDLAYKGMSPDERSFTIHMSETSTAEEEELKNALGSGMETVDKMFDILEKAAGDRYSVDFKAALEYMNTRVLKLNDLDMATLLTEIAEKALPDMLTPGTAGEADIAPTAGMIAPGDSRGGMEPVMDEPARSPEQVADRVKVMAQHAQMRRLNDCRAALPTSGSRAATKHMCREQWSARYGGMQFKLTEGAKD